MTIFSFHPVKAISAGEGGMITTNDESTYRRLIRLRSHGINKLDDSLQLPNQALSNGELNPWYYEMQELGFHYRITDIQCALALSQLKKLEHFINRRRQLVTQYDAVFKDSKTCSPIQLSGRNLSGHHLYVVRIKFIKIGVARQEIMSRLRSMGIVTQVHYIPVPIHPYYQKLGFHISDYPVANSYYQDALSLPLFYDLTDTQQNQVIRAIKELVG